MTDHKELGAHERHGGRDDLASHPASDAASHDAPKVLTTIGDRQSMLAAMALIAASAPVERSSYEIQAPRMPEIIGWDFAVDTARRRSRTIREKRSTRSNRERMQKASRKRNRGQR